MLRVKFADDNIGTGSYTLPYNPASLQAEDSYPLSKKKAYGSETVLFLHPHDDREVSFIWRGWPVSNTVISGMVSTMRGWLYATKYVALGDIYGSYRTLFPVTGWNGPFRVIDVSAPISETPGLFYGEITLVLQKE